MLGEKSRSLWFQNLSPIVGEEAIGEMLAHYPATEGGQPVTKDYLDSRLAGQSSVLRGEMSELRVEMSELRIEMSHLRVELHQQTKQLLIWIPTAMAAISGVVAFLSRFG